MLSNDPCDQLFRFRAGNQDSFTDGEGSAVKFGTADDVLYGASFLYVPDYFSHAYFRAFRARSIRLDHDIGEPHFEQFVTEQGRGGTRLVSIVQGGCGGVERIPEFAACRHGSEKRYVSCQCNVYPADKCTGRFGE